MARRIQENFTQIHFCNYIDFDLKKKNKNKNRVFYTSLI